MSLLDDFMEPYVMIERHTESDGEGGFNTVYVEGAPFEAAVTLDTTQQARIGLASGVTSVYTVTTRKNVQLEYHDIIKNTETNRYYRITSDGGEKKTPMSAGLDMSQVTAEKWELK